jgi:PAS domain S-box-containing protein
VHEALDLVPTGIAVWGVDGRPRALNRAGAEIWGVARLAEGGVAPPRVVAESGCERREHPALVVLRDGADGEHDLQVERMDGQTVPVRCRLRALRDASGAVIGVMDAFERRDPPTATPAADRWDRAYDDLADALPFVMWWTDAEGRTVSCNRRFWDYAGLDRIASRPDWTLAVHAEDRSRARSLWTQAIAAGAMFCTELRLRRFDGSTHWFLARAWAVRDGQGAISHWLGTCANIDDLKRLELELRRCNEELASFASVASHDLQEPLRMVARFLDLLRKRSGRALDVTSLEYLAFAHDGARRMQELIRKLLDYSRIGRAPLPTAPVEAAAVAHDAVLNLASVIEENGATVSIAALPAVRMDRVQLIQLLQNLIANALKYRSQAPPVIEVSAERDGGEWEFRVRDNGIGIAHDNQQRIFGLFQRVHGEGEYPGAGIGLAVCKKIVENHGGRIWVTSEPGRGSCFHFTVPVV